MNLDQHLDAIGTDPDGMAGAAMAGDRCRAGRILDTVTDEQAAKIRARMAKGQNLDALAAALRRSGHPIGATTLRRHRDKACPCYDAATAKDAA